VVDGAAVDNTKKIQDLVDAYAKILSDANGKNDVTEDAGPTQVQFAKVGVTGVDTPNEVKLLGDVVDIKATEDVNSVAELQVLADAVAAVMNNAAGSTPKPSVAQLQDLGLSGVSEGNLSDIQAKIALGSGGWAGKGFMQGTQSRLNFLPEKHTDFIFTTLAEEFGFIGAFSLLVLYALILMFLIVAAIQNRDRFSQLIIIGVAVNFFLYLAINLAMVMGMAPVVGVPLPLLSYGGSATLVIMLSFGLVQSAIVHRLR
jgi:hypothetical protein